MGLTAVEFFIELKPSQGIMDYGGAIKRSTLRFIIAKLIKKWETRDRPFRSVNRHWPSKNLRATFGCKINHSFRTLSLPASVHSNPSIYLISPVGEVLSVADGISIHSRA